MLFLQVGNVMDSEELSFKCPKCGKPMKEKLVKLATANVTCPACGTEIECKELHRLAKNIVAKATSDLRKAIGRRGKHKKRLKL